jgi:hypothetical protein
MSSENIENSAARDRLEQTIRGHVRRAVRVMIVVFLAPVLVTIIASIIYKRLSAVSEIEYKVVSGYAREWLPQGLDDGTVAFSVSGEACPNLYVYDISIWNRTDTAFAKFNIRPRVEGAGKLVRKMIIYGDDYDAGMVNWASAEKGSLEVLLDLLNVNWEASPNFRLRFFFSDKVDGVKLLSNQPGVEFIPYRKEVESRWLFGLDGVFYGTVCIFVIVIILVAGRWFSVWQFRRAYRNYLDLVVINSKVYLSDLEASLLRRCLLFSVFLHIYTLGNGLLFRRNVKVISMPDELKGPLVDAGKSTVIVNVKKGEVKRKTQRKRKG